MTAPRSPLASVATFDARSAAAESEARRLVEAQTQVMDHRRVIAMAVALIEFGPQPDESTPVFLARVLARMQSEADSLGLDPIAGPEIPYRSRRSVAREMGAAS